MYPVTKNYERSTADGDGLLSSSGAARAKYNITAITLTAGDSVDASVVLYDGSASGPVLWRLKAEMKTSRPVSFPMPLEAVNGIYAVITGTGAVVSAAVA